MTRFAPITLVVLAALTACKDEQPQGAPPPRTAVTEFVAQRGDVRVYVQNRRSGDAALRADEMDATRTLFDAARASAFGN